MSFKHGLGQWQPRLSCRDAVSLQIMQFMSKGGFIHERAVRWLANDHCLCQLLLANIREIFQIIFLLQSLGYSLNLRLRQHMDGASTPPGTSETATQGTCAACNSTDVVDLGSTALVGSATGVLGLVQELTQVVDALGVESGGLDQTGLEVENTAGFFESVQGTLAEKETFCLDGERGQKLGLELADRDT